MAIAFTELSRSASNTDASTYTTASVTLTAGRLYLVGVGVSKVASGVPSAVATTGGAVSFALVGHGNYGSTHNASLWWAVPVSTITATIAISASSGTGADWSVVEVTGAATASPIVQSKVGTVGIGNTSITVTLDSNLVTGNGRASYGAATANSTLALTGTWIGGTTNNRSTPPATGRAAWDAIPTPSQRSVVWTPGTSSALGAVIVEIAAAADWSVGMIPL